MKIGEIKEILAKGPTDAELAKLAKDERSGVQKLLEAYYRRLERQRLERERFDKMLTYERQYLELPGIEKIAGLDEAGRGPLAGPLVIAGVILPEDIFISGLNDSKKLSAQKREELYPEIVEKAVCVRVNVVSVSNIDDYNIYSATQKGMEEILDTMSVRPQVALVDAMHPVSRGIETVPLIHGDALSASIAAASVIAKVTRDRIMLELDAVCPEYGFAKNKGYGSQLHMDAIRKCGATRIHRRSFEPVRSMELGPAPVRDNYLYEPVPGREDEGLRRVVEDLKTM